MSRWRRNSLWALALLLLLAVLIASQIKVEKQPQWQQDEAQIWVNGPFYGLQRFLQAQAPQLPQHSWRRWPVALKQRGEAAAPGVLLFVADSSGAYAEDYAALLDWVAAGNHVVLPLPEEASVVADAPNAAEGQAGDDGWVWDGIDWRDIDAELAQPLSAAQWQQWLGEHFGLHLRDAAPEPASGTAPAPACLQWQQQQETALRQALLPLPETRVGQQQLQHCSHYLNHIGLPENRRLSWYAAAGKVFDSSGAHGLLWQGQGAAGSQIVRVRYGEGTVTWLSRIDPLGNPRAPIYFDGHLGNFDHAHLAAYLAGDKSELWFVRDLHGGPAQPQRPAWWRMWQAQPWLMLSLSLLLAAGVWRVAVRMGPMQQLPIPQARYLRAHLGAQGRFFSRHGSRSAQLRLLQAAMWQQWQQRWPQWPQLDADARLRTVCRHSQVPPRQALLWLRPIPENMSRRDYIAYLQAHQRLCRRHGARQPAD